MAAKMRQRDRGNPPKTQWAERAARLCGESEPLIGGQSAGPGAVCAEKHEEMIQNHARTDGRGSAVSQPPQRSLFWFSMGVCLVSLMLTLLQPSGFWQSVTLCGAGACLLCGLALLCNVRGAAMLLTAGMLAGCLWCGGWGALRYLPAEKLAGAVGDMRVELTQYGVGYGDYGITYGVLTRVGDTPCRQRVKVYLEDGSPDCAPGDVLLVHGTLRAAAAGYRAGLLQKGCFLTLSQDGEGTIQPGAAKTVLRNLRIFSHLLSQRITALLPGDEGGLLTALLSGDRSNCSNQLDQGLIISGTRHVTAVSGLHVSILAGAMIWLLGRRAGSVAAAVLSVCYAAVVGFPPSVVRAVVMVLVMTLGFWLRREADPLTSLAAALLLLLLYNPFSILSPGLLLSFAATLGLICFASPITAAMKAPLKKLRPAFLRRMAESAVSAMGTSLSAMLTTFPLTMLFFDTVPLLGLLSNVLILWAVALSMELGIVVLTLSLLWMPAALFLARWVLRWPLWWMVQVVKTIGGWTFAATDSANGYLALAWTGVFILTLIWKRRSMSTKRGVAAVAAILTLTLLLSAGERALYGEVSIQNCSGSGIVLLRSGGQTAAVNCGKNARGAECVETALQRWNQTGLNTILCTTGNYKTQGGLTAAAAAAGRPRILLPRGSAFSQEGNDKDEVLWYHQAGTISVDNLRLELLPGGEHTFACRIVGKDVSLLDACGLTCDQARAAVSAGDSAAAVLLVDDGVASDGVTLFHVCQQVKPLLILVAGSGYFSYDDSFCGIPMSTVEADGASIRFLR